MTHGATSAVRHSVYSRARGMLSRQVIAEALATEGQHMLQLGVLLYEVLTGAHPFMNRTPAERCTTNSTSRCRRSRRAAANSLTPWMPSSSAQRPRHRPTCQRS